MNYENVLDNLRKSLSKEPPEKYTRNISDDPGVVNDILSSFDTILDDDELTDYKKGLKLTASNYLPDDLCKYDYVACGAEDPSIKSRLVKLKTRIFYKQVKFNLLREESEGYAKAIAELFMGDKYNDHLRTLSRLQKLIGQFNLDPNRVIDIILDCFEANPDRSKYYIGLLDALKVTKSDLADILKRKFIYQEKVDGSAYPLCNLASVIIQQNLIDLLPFFAFLTPDQKDLILMWKQNAELIKKRAKQAEIVVTTSSDLKFDEDDREKMEVDTKGGASQPFFLAFNNQIAEDEKLCENFYDDNVVYSKNLKLGLICALLESGAFLTANLLMDRCPQNFGLLISPRIQHALAALIDYSISHMYNELIAVPMFSIVLHHQSTKTFTFNQPKNWDEFISQTMPMILQTGPYIAANVHTAFKLLRLVTKFFKMMHNDESLKKHENLMIDIIDYSLLPALTLLESNFSYSDELWGLLSQFTYQQRFRLYGHWKNLHTPKFLEVQRAIVLGRTKYCLKRLSRDSVKLIGRQLGKLCHIHPFSVFEYLLAQIQVFQNFITPVVDSLRFLSSLELDILTFFIMETLSSSDKGQLKADDGTLSMWITALATFIGALFKKYPSDLTGMLQFIINELKNGKSIDLLILREIITNMSGIDANATLTEDGIDALTGGDILKQEIFHTAAVRSSKRLSSRLREALLKDDLLSALFILMAQQKSCVIYIDSEILPLKLTGQLLDQCRETFIQFNNFIQFAFKLDEAASILPPIDVMISDYFLPIECAMYFWREYYVKGIENKWKEDIKKLKGDDENSRIDETQSLLMYSQSFSNTLDMLEKKLSPMKKKEFWNELTPKLYYLFWLLDLGDLQCPTELYEKMIAKAKSERSDASHESTSKKRTKEDKAYVLEKKLKEELRTREEHVLLIKAVLSQQADNLFVAIPEGSSQMIKFLQSCLLPRATFSEADATFCAKFLYSLHLHKAKNLQTLLFFDKIFCDASFIINGLSEKESHAIGKFYQVMLSYALKWHDSSLAFKDECEGCALLLKKKSEEGEIKESIDYESYRSICFKWHFRLTKTFNNMLNNGSYVSKRNALIVLTKSLASFPAITIHFNSLRKSAEILRDNERGKRDDLSLLAASYVTQLRIRQQYMVPVDDFYTKDRTDTTVQSSDKSRKRITASDSADVPSPKKTTNVRTKR